MNAVRLGILWLLACLLWSAPATAAAQPPDAFCGPHHPVVMQHICVQHPDRLCDCMVHELCKGEGARKLPPASVQSARSGEVCCLLQSFQLPAPSSRPANGRHEWTPNRAHPRAVPTPEPPPPR